ncbi:L-glutamate gamma-semialdehyde dehydrogenase [Paenibacillus beijingensis]|uniref:L-glutamate gamma-semialdehyde dehydrogenase n=1 Tax=Paenibacillus beijingensis TaxID=1126833 RepID=A0A0D5NMK8_9BACL|nr:L-glutamate gamma-semialdehyde dehydrogenase [Paenibacillus beijingensis]AJY76516.1 1-pyrroline-5-carboxylate dehydrogenase [Paenibacillus beijingensis]
MMEQFRNEPLTDFRSESSRAAFGRALDSVKSDWGRTYPLLIGGKEIVTGRLLESVNPARHSEVVGLVAQAGRSDALQALDAAASAFAPWSAEPFAARARILYKAAAHLRRRKHEFSAWMVCEAGKTWAEADADTAEAIDFLEFYGREAERIGAPQPLIPLSGEDNELTYIPLGVGVIIPPWNFPLAIMAGMTCSALVCGNTVVLKPASATAVIASKFVSLLLEAGLPEGVVQFVPGAGAEIGDALVEHPLTRFVSFTGSLETGLRIYEKAAKHAPGQRWLKRVVAELGGKDAIIVDKGADLSAAAEGIVASAFGFSGQKCSACSRAIIHKDVYDQVLDDVIRRTSGLRVGDPAEFGNDMGPVIDRSALNKIRDYVEIGSGEGKVVWGGGTDDSTGFYVQPTIIDGVSSKARVAQEEIFGPVLSFIRAEDFGSALEAANDSLYGLTGAVYSRKREHLEQARRAFHVGNLYLNRKCTGALVGVHPFGGFNLSGTDSKAGGSDYLLQFTQAKAVSERM